MGWALLHSKRIEEGCDALREAARLDEGDPEVARLLCEAAGRFVQSGQPVPVPEAWVAAQRFHLRGRWLALTGDVEGAVDLWETQMSWLGNLEFFNPLYDAIRDHPAFQRMMQRYRPPEH